MESPETKSRVDKDGVPDVMRIDEIISDLAPNGRMDLRQSIDLASCSDQPWAGGGFCNVYQGRLRDGTNIAIKCLRAHDTSMANLDVDKENILKSTMQELYYWSRLKHANILPLLGLTIFRGHISMISEWMDNGNLTSFISMNPQADRVKLCMEICAGLCYIHKSNMAHGDLKAVNVMVSPNGTAMIADFGNADLKDLTLKSTNSSECSLSVRWAAPELLLGEGGSGPQVSQEADVYAYGMTVLEVLTGQVPFEGANDNRVLGMVAYEERIPARPHTGVNDELWSTLVLCWTRNPSLRPGISDIDKRLQGIYPTRMSRPQLRQWESNTVTALEEIPDHNHDLKAHSASQTLVRELLGPCLYFTAPVRRHHDFSEYSVFGLASSRGVVFVVDYHSGYRIYPLLDYPCEPIVRFEIGLLTYQWNIWSGTLVLETLDTVPGVFGPRLQLRIILLYEHVEAVQNMVKIFQENSRYQKATKSRKAKSDVPVPKRLPPSGSAPTPLEASPTVVAPVESKARTDMLEIEAEIDRWVESAAAGRELGGRRGLLCPENGCNIVITAERSSTLKTHLYTHYGIRPFHCDRCSSRFISPASLAAHIHNNHL